jgi:hypothetical protein
MVRAEAKADLAGSVVLQLANHVFGKHHFVGKQFVNEPA